MQEIQIWFLENADDFNLVLASIIQHDKYYKLTCRKFPYTDLLKDEEFTKLSSSLNGAKRAFNTEYGNGITVDWRVFEKSNKTETKF